MKDKLETAHVFRVYIGTTVKQVLKANPKRTNLKIYNNSSNNLYVCTDATGVTTSGYPVATGGKYDNEHFQGALWLIADGSNSDIRIEEDSC